MRAVVKIIFVFLIFSPLFAQESTQVTGIVVAAKNYRPLSDVHIQIDNSEISVYTDHKGQFIIEELSPSGYVLQIRHPNFLTKRLEINTVGNAFLNLGVIVLQTDYLEEVKNLARISLVEDELDGQDLIIDNPAGILQASKDLFQRRAAFDFSQAFFRPRGYDSKYAALTINGLSMNRPFNGRPQWSNWGGLNDVIRNQQLTYGLGISHVSFGSLLGATNIIIRPSKFRAGTKISYSYANRSYAGRAMVTHHSGRRKSGLSYSFSASRRWAREGFIDGTPYNAFSLFAGLEHSFGKHSVGVIAMYAPTTRGSGTAITERVYETFGRKYNPNWGYQRGQIRSARLRTIKEPLFMFNYTYQGEKLAISTNLGYQTGFQGSSRLDYINAPNPYPNYWRYLNSIDQAPQISWSKLYDANQTTLNVQLPGAARYLLYDDRTEDKTLSGSTLFNITLGKLKLDAGATFSRVRSENYAIPLDLLGAAYYNDVNPFNLINGHASRNDLNSHSEKGLDDRIKYNYSIFHDQMSGFLQLGLSFKKLGIYLGSNYNSSGIQREGYFLNESFLENSFGRSSRLNFSNIGFKAGLLYKITGRHLLSLNSALFNIAPTIRNSFINIRENNEPIPALKSERIRAFEANYIIRAPMVKGRFSGYLTRFQDVTELNFIFAQIGSGTDFFQEVVSGIEKKHLGVEMGVEIQVSPSTTLSAAGSYGVHRYTADPTVTVNFDTNGYNADLINEIGFKDLGTASINNLYVANGPQKAFSIGLEYKDPNYWWIGATANYLAGAYVDPATVRRTADFFKDPDDPLGGTFNIINEDLAKKLLQQERFDDFYLLNLVGGKSFRLKKGYLSLFISINNLFESEFKTGGYEQARTSTYESLAADASNGTSNRVFGNKYWYGPGRTFFINIACSF